MTSFLIRQSQSQATPLPRLALLALVALLAAPFAGCITPISERGAPGRDSARAAASFDDARWRYQPNSWSRLGAIEEWLTVHGPSARPEQLAEARLLLAEGRLEFAMRDAETAQPNSLDERRRRCREGFQSVLSDATAPADLRARAREGLARLDRPQVRERAQHRPTGSIIRRTSWGARPPLPSRMTPHRGSWTRITVHHTTVHAANLARSSASVTAASLRRFQKEHMDGPERMGDVGYHFLIDPAGRIYEGRSLRWRGGHAGGANNLQNIGVCLLGHFDEERPTRASLGALGSLLDDLRGRNGIARDRVYGHGELKATACPGRHLMTWVRGYRRVRTTAALAPDQGRPAISR